MMTQSMLRELQNVLRECKDARESLAEAKSHCQEVFGKFISLSRSKEFLQFAKTRECDLFEIGSNSFALVEWGYETAKTEAVSPEVRFYISFATPKT